MRAGVLRLAVSSPKSTTPRFSAALRPLGIAFARHASIIPISSQRNAGDVLVSSRANRPQRTLRRQLSSATPEDATIYALSTAPGTAAIAIIRISGTACIDIYRALCPGRKVPKPRYATLRTLYDPQDRSQKLDANALVLFFPAPQTVTGEDVLELHVHGGNAVVKAVLAAIFLAAHSKQQLVRYAEPGEFTRRAFRNGRLDLTEVEALGDTLAAETEQQRRLAVRGASNALGERYEIWRQKLLYARGELEALIDFSEDQQFDDPPEVLYKSVADQVKTLTELLHISIRNAFRGELLRNGINIALIGAPNAGKSSLLNRIVNREAAIVSREAGTTRDVVEVGVDIGGYYCRFGDLAGLRSASSEDATSPISEIEIEGMRRAKQRAANADVVIVVLSVEPDSDSMANSFAVVVNPEVAQTLRTIDTGRQDVLYVVNKSDLLPNNEARAALQNKVNYDLTHSGLPASTDMACIITCRHTSEARADTEYKTGIQTFLQGLITTFQRKTSALLPQETVVPGQSYGDQASAESLGASERHRLLLQQCVSQLEEFLNGLAGTQGEQPSAVEGAEPDVVLAAEHLRGAAECLSKITGKGEAGDVEEVLGVVFEKFCVGK